MRNAAREFLASLGRPSHGPHRASRGGAASPGVPRSGTKYTTCYMCLQVRHQEVHFANGGIRYIKGNRKHSPTRLAAGRGTRQKSNTCSA